MSLGLRWACGILSAALLVCACLATRDPEIAEPAEPSVVLSPTERDIGIVPLGEHQFTVTVVNQGRHSTRIVGVSAACGRGCCYGPVVKSPVTLAAGETRSYPYRLAVKATGPFVAEITVYFADGGVVERMMTIRGIGVENEDAAPFASSPPGSTR
jgi:hypothetical protein